MPKKSVYEGKTSLEGLRIATSYPRILSGFLEKNNINAELYDISGAVEITPSLGLADAIFDIVSTGSTLLANGLREVETVLESQAILIANPTNASNPFSRFQPQCPATRTSVGRSGVVSYQSSSHAG